VQLVVALLHAQLADDFGATVVGGIVPVLDGFFSFWLMRPM
jgi:hypothetical protein